MGIRGFISSLGYSESESNSSAGVRTGLLRFCSPAILGLNHEYIPHIILSNYSNANKLKKIIWNQIFLSDTNELQAIICSLRSFYTWENFIIRYNIKTVRVNVLI